MKALISHAKYTVPSAEQMGSHPEVFYAFFTDAMIALVEEEGDAETAEEMKKANKIAGNTDKFTDGGIHGGNIFISHAIPLWHRKKAESALNAGQLFANAARIVMAADWELQTSVKRRN